MKEVLSYLSNKFPMAEVFTSCDKDFVIVRSIIGQSNFGKNASNEQVIVPIYNTQKLHIDTVRLQMLNK